MTKRKVLKVGVTARELDVIAGWQPQWPRKDNTVCSSTKSQLGHAAGYGAAMRIRSVKPDFWRDR